MQIFSLVISLLSVHSSSQRTRKSSHQHFRKDSFLNLPKTARPGRNEERLRSARKQLRAPRPGVSLAAFSYADRRDRSIHPSIRRVRVRPRRARSRSDVSSGIRVAQLERRKGERERGGLAMTSGWRLRRAGARRGPSPPRPITTTTTAREGQRLLPCSRSESHSKLLFRNSCVSARE